MLALQYVAVEDLLIFDDIDRICDVIYYLPDFKGFPIFFFKVLREWSDAHSPLPRPSRGPLGTRRTCTLYERIPEPKA